SLIGPAVEVALLIEYETDTVAEAARAAAALRDQQQRGERLALVAVSAHEPEAMERLWRLRELALPSLYGLRGGPQPIACVEDVGVPPEDLAIYLHRVQEVLKRYETTASFLVHAGTGQVHTRPFLDLQRPEDVDKLWALTGEIHQIAIELGGTVSTQHGTGLARTPWVEKQYGKLYPVFRELKAIFDPQRIFNPGKIVGPDPELPAWPLRAVSHDGETARGSNGETERKRDGETERENPSPDGLASAPQDPVSLSLRPSVSPSPLLLWQPDEMRTEYLSCNGCGQCRTEAPGQRMCPIFRATHAEAATPRAKANLL